MDSEEFTKMMSEHAGDLAGMSELLDGSLRMLPLGPCPNHPEGKHMMCNDEVSVVSLVVPSKNPIGLEFALWQCPQCRDGLLGMAPFGERPSPVFQLGGFGIELSCDHGKDPDPPL